MPKKRTVGTYIERHHLSDELLGLLQNPPHKDTHEKDGSDEIDGDSLEFDIPTTPVHAYKSHIHQ